MSEQRDFSLGTVLNILLTDTNCKASYFANHYVFKDASLVSKWLHGTQFPTTDIFPLIVRFAAEQSNAATRSIMRIEIDRLLSRAGLDDETKRALAGAPDFDGYLLGVLNVLANLKKVDRSAAARANGSNESAGGAPSLPDTPAAPLGRAILAADIVYAALAAVCGETVWQLIAFALGLSPVPGALGCVAGGWGIAWGLTLALPAVGFALLSLNGKSAYMRTLTLARKLAFLLCYCAAGCTAGLLLGVPGMSGPSPLRTIPAPALVPICSLILSFLPMLSVYALLRRPRFAAGAFLLLEFGPCLLCAFVALPFMLRPAILQAGDIFAGYVLELSMYCAVRTVLGSHPGKIKLRTFGAGAGLNN